MSKVVDRVNDFVQQVNKQTPKKIDPDDAAMLIDEASLLLEALAGVP